MQTTLYTHLLNLKTILSCCDVAPRDQVHQHVEPWPKVCTATVYEFLPQQVGITQLSKLTLSIPSMEVLVTLELTPNLFQHDTPVYKARVIKTWFQVWGKINQIVFTKPWSLSLGICVHVDDWAHMLTSTFQTLVEIFLRSVKAITVYKQNGVTMSC